MSEASSERLVGAIATLAQRLLAASELDGVVPGMLESLGSAMGASRCFLYRNRPGEDGEILASLAGEWCTPGVATQGAAETLRDLPTLSGPYADYGIPLSRGEIVARATEEFAEPVRSVLEAIGTRATLCVPVFSDRRWWGSLGFDDCPCPSPSGIIKKYRFASSTPPGTNN